MRLILLGFIFVIINFLFKGKRGTYFMFLGILLVMGLQGKAGFDYLAYEIEFMLLNSSSNVDVDQTEICWIWLNKLFSFADFYVLVFFISLIQYLVLVKFVNKYVCGVLWKNFAFFIFYFTQSFLGFQISGLRQGLAIELLVLTFILIENKQYLMSILCTIIMYNIHHSSLLIIPFIILFYIYRKNDFAINYKFDKNIIKILPILFVVLYIIKESFIAYITPFALQFSTSEFEGYISQLEYQEISPLIILYDLICIIVICLFLKQSKGCIRYMSYLSLIAFFGESILFGLGDLPRLTYYFSIFNLVVLPNVGIFLFKKYNKFIAIGFVILCCAYSMKTFIPYVTSPDIPRIMNYKFIFEL